MATSKKAAAPKAAPVVETEAEEGTLDVGTQVRFLGYGEDTPEAERVLTEDTVYTIVGFTEPDGEDLGGNPIVQIENPSFNAKKKEHPTTNPKLIDVEAFADELEVVEEGEDAAGAEEVAAEAEVAPPVAKRAAKTAAAAPAAAAKTAAKTPAKAAKTAAKTPAAKKTAAKKAAPKEVAPPVDPDAVPDLASEDADVLTMVNESEDLIATAQELDAQAAQTDWQLGGLLYHIKKDKTHHNLVDEAGAPITTYQGPGGFDQFLQDYLNVEYRKAMYLIDIYIYFNQAGIADAAETVARIGWTKASKIAKHLVGDDAKPEELIELASEKSVAELSEAIKDTVTVGGTKGEVKKRVTLKFRYLEEEGASINAILEEAKDTLGLKDIGEALSHIVTEWGTTNAGGAATKEAAPAQRAPMAAAKKAAPRRAAAAAH